VLEYDLERTQVDIPSSAWGRLAKYEEYDSRAFLMVTNSDGRSRTTMIPRESGPKASSRASEGTEPTER
jgi:hypothetical protein